MPGCHSVRRALALSLFVISLALPSRASVVFVNKNATGAVHDGATWGTSFLTVQAGINATVSGDEVWVAAASYREAITLKPGVKLYGGFAGAESARSQRDPVANVTLIGNTDPLLRVYDSIVTAEAGCGRDTVLSGFTITGGTGKSTNTPSGVRYNGGGIHLATASPTIENNTIVDNTTLLQWIATQYFGGGDGGGIACYSGSAPLIIGNLIARNLTQKLTDGGLGAGVYCSNSSPTLVNNTIVLNTKDFGNTVPGGAVAGEGTSAPTLVNNVIAFNVGGVSLSAGVLLKNDVYSNATAWQANYSGIPDATGTEGNLSVDPLFANKAAGDYRLLPGSPCIDAGDDSILTLGQTDLDGNPRKLGAHVDMGAYEFHTAGFLTLADAAVALRVAGGLSGLDQPGLARLNVLPDSPVNSVDVRDAIGIARKAVGLDVNP